MKRGQDSVCERTSRSGRRRTSSVSGEKGIALVLVLILSAMALAMMAALVYMLTVGTQASGLHKRYRNAVEAGKAGTEISYDLIAARGNLSLPDIGLAIPAKNVGGFNCMTEKLNNNTNKSDGTLNWNSSCNNTDSIDPSQPTTYDWSFQLGDAGGGQPFTVYAKIVDTVEGNSAGSIGLTKGGVVSTNSGEITVMSRPYLYTLEVDTERSASPQERAKYSILYQY